MKKFNAQAETHSGPAWLPRASRPRTEVFEQNDTARTSELHALHLRSSIFFYLFLDYKHKHTADPAARYGAHALNM